MGRAELRTAIISDIHANLPALEAVLADVADQGVTSIYCLGDVIGYGPSPRECLEISREFDVNLLGNHEEAVLFDPVGFNARARAAVEWTKNQLSLPDSPREVNVALWDHLGSMKETHSEGDFLFVHGSPRDPTREYVFINDIEDPEKMDSIFDSFDVSTCFVGHTHTAGVFSSDLNFLYPSAIGNKIRVGDEKQIINVGSVGQPRDGDSRGSYVILDGEEVSFRRIQYDIDRTVALFEGTPLPEYLAQRLREGR